MKKLVKEYTMEELSLKARETEEMNESILCEEEYINNSRANIMKKGFAIKQLKKEFNSNK